jgi:hypothetical protein
VLALLHAPRPAAARELALAGAASDSCSRRPPYVLAVATATVSYGRMALVMTPASTAMVGVYDAATTRA